MKAKQSWKDVCNSFGNDKFVESFVFEYFPTGSRTICDPAPTDTDQDWVVKVSPRRYKTFIEILTEDFGFENCSKDYADSRSTSLKKGDVNLILVRDSFTYDSWKTATRICQKLNLTEKKDRVYVFKQLQELYNETTDYF